MSHRYEYIHRHMNGNGKGPMHVQFEDAVGNEDELTPLNSTPGSTISTTMEVSAEDKLYFQHDVLNHSRKQKHHYQEQSSNGNSKFHDGEFKSSECMTRQINGRYNPRTVISTSIPGDYPIPPGKYCESSNSSKKRRPERRDVAAYYNITIIISVAAMILCCGALIFDVVSAPWLFGRNPSNEITNHQSTNMFDEVGRYIVEDYDAQVPFSDFLPGLAGIYGKPLYAFFVNRGQAVAAFGVGSKEYPIMEYESANKAYQSTPFLGFRTFLQGQRRSSGNFLVEPFSPLTTAFVNSKTSSSTPKRIMFNGENEVQLQELDYENRLETNVTYFILPEEDFGAFVRRTTITNTDPKESVTLSMLDGLARMQPAGGKLNRYLKNRGQSVESYMKVDFPYNDSISMPFFRLTTEPGDTASVHVQKRGHYCLSFVEGRQTNDGSDSRLLPIVYDTSKVFGEDTTLLRPIGLYGRSVSEIVQGPQFGRAKTSSCFAAVEGMTLKPGETITISSFYGAAENILEIPVYARRLNQNGFVLYKLTRTREIIRQITQSVSTRTSHRLFDAHVQQMFLDNSLRGGIPLVLGDQDDNDGILNVDEDPRLKVFHVFSRIHGDLERDYNDFVLSPTFFSQGPGNFRDVAQNRRNDVIFNPRTGSFNVRMFLSYIQADGYEPLSVEAVVLTIEDEAACDFIAEQAVGRADGHRAQREALSAILKGGPFRPGQLFGLMEEQNIDLVITRQELIDMVAIASKSMPMAVFETGFWADHWTYYMDMINSYLAVFPDGEERLMYDEKLPYFFSPAHVQPRVKKYVLSLSIDGQNHHVQQLDATVEEDPQKRAQMDKFRSGETGWYEPRAHWQGDSDDVVFKSSSAAKLFLLATLKFSTRDAYGMGIEYEGGRPGWDDANNGIPGMLGSGMPETYELKVLLHYLQRINQTYRRSIEIPIELSQLLDAVRTALDSLDGYEDMETVSEIVPSELFEFWDTVSTAREQYRERVKIAFSGKVTTLSPEELEKMLEDWIREVDRGIHRAMLIGTKEIEAHEISSMTPTYFAYEVTLRNETGEFNQQGHPLVIPKEMKVRQFPLFLEGPTRAMKTANGTEASSIYQQVQKSPLHDADLAMYTVSAGLEGQPVDIGRTMAFPSGWQENQAVYLHMSYKFYLELLRHKLYDEFFAEVTSGGILPFMERDKYGRSLLQCSSFIVSSAFEDPSKQGRGYLARLSGSTAEFLSMWVLMFIGPEPFFLDPLDGDKLKMQLKPSLPQWLFEVRNDTEDDPLLQQLQKEHPNTLTLSFKLFSSIHVHYYNPRGIDLFDVSPVRYRIGQRDGSIFEIQGAIIPTDLADKIRRVVFVDFIEAYF